MPARTSPTCARGVSRTHWDKTASSASCVTSTGIRSVVSKIDIKDKTEKDLVAIEFFCDFCFELPLLACNKCSWKRQHNAARSARSGLRGIARGPD